MKPDFILPMRRSIKAPVFQTFGLAVLATLAGSCAGLGQDAASSVERSVHAISNKVVQIGLYVNVRPDCTSGPLPTIRLASPPSSGKVEVKSAKVKATNYKQCLALEVPAYAAFYKSSPDFLGEDLLTIEVKYPQGRTEIQKITVKVAGPGNQQKI